MEQIGRYQVVRKLGKGGMGSVYLSIAPAIDKVVAVKLLDPAEIMVDILGMDQLRSIFLEEAKTMSRLDPAYIVNVWDFAEDDQGRPFFVMEYICNNLGTMIGECFQVEKRSRVINPEKVVHYGRQLLACLAYLHHNQIVHRDIKPHNILVTDDDRVKVCDFGMALVKGVSFSGPDTMQVGSPYYTPPEQSRSPSTVDGRADLYSLAVLLYRMLTGSLPGMQSFSLSLVNPLYDARWDSFFSRALSWNPGERFQSAAEMLAALESLHLHWQRCRGKAETPSPGPGSGVRLRTEQENVCGARARRLFAVDELFHALAAVVNDFRETGDGVWDQATGLIWQDRGSPYPLAYPEALQYVDALAGQRGENWRLPTVNELLSLTDPPHASLTSKGALADLQPRLWSCDQHGRHEAWYVNMDMAFADTQDHLCRHFVRAVRSAEDGSP